MLGYTAYDYAAGKQDWLAHGLPYEGEADLVGRHLATGLPVVAPGARMSDLPGAGEEPSRALVCTEEGVLLGELPPAAIRDARPQDRVMERMLEGPETIRPSEPAGRIARVLEEAGVSEILVTRSDGLLLGAFRANETRDGDER